MKISAVRYIGGSVPIPNGGFWPAWWPGQHIPGVWYNLVVIETDEGLTGFGPGRLAVSGGAFAAEGVLRRMVLGADPFQIGWLTEAPEMVRQQRPRPIVIELALWDLLGKAAGQPVYKLLGAHRHQVRVYCSTGSVLSAEAHIAQGWEAWERGYRAFKLRLHRPTVAEDIAAARAIRMALPPEMTLMADANQAQNPYWSRADALYAARALEEMGMAWLEEPLPMYDVEGLAELAAKVEIPIAGAENQVQVYAFRRYLEANALDILQPDIGGCGGLLEWRKIAALAEAHQRPCLAHVWDNGLAAAVMLHASASIPNCGWGEVTDDVQWPARERDLILAEPLRVADGMMAVPQGAGWGVALNWDAVQAHAAVDVRIEA